ncbi:ATPase [Candidatus Saccharibacteria bacterium]|nr:MAG: ATPase [Candidatus Saccharibacteria bacterium]
MYHPINTSQPIRIAVMGLSGVGKTTLARCLPSSRWFHYSVDYRIWTHYLGDELNDYLKKLAMSHPLLCDMLKRDAITVEHRVHFDNLLATSLYMGMLGNPKKHGSTLPDFTERMARHAESEIAAMLDIPRFIKRAEELYKYPHFLADLSGSLCEVVEPANDDDPVLQIMDDTVTLIYIRATKAHEKVLIERNIADPKPIYYRPDFVAAELPKLLEKFNAADVTEISPRQVGAYLYPRLLAHRVERYEAIAAKHALTLTMEEAAAIRSEADLLDRLSRS